MEGVEQGHLTVRSALSARGGFWAPHLHGGESHDANFAAARPNCPGGWPPWHAHCPGASAGLSPVAALFLATFLDGPVVAFACRAIVIFIVTDCRWASVTGASEATTSMMATQLLERHPTRRRLLQGVAGASLTLATAPRLLRCAAAQSWGADPFSLGVASGAPRDDGFVLWTRLAPEPLSIDPAAPGGMHGGDVPISYEIATDSTMRQITRRGEATAEEAFAYSVHVDVRGLESGRPYWFRFMSGSATSRVGRAATLPAPEMSPDRLRFGFVSCSNYEHGYFSAYRHLADENPEFVVFLGDYIYETIEEKRAIVRRHSDGIVAATLPTYRNRYAQYRLDPDLQRLHAEVPALVTWDDHEVQNDYADKWSETFDDPERFLLRRAAAYRAFYEHMPVRPMLSRPEGPVMRIYDRFAYGDLVQISMIDGRQYRSREACYAPPS